MRTFAILNVNVGQEITENIVKKLPEGSNVRIFSLKEAMTDELRSKIGEIGGKYTVKTDIFPQDVGLTIPKLRNYMFNALKSEGISGFLHVIEDQISIIGETSQFLDEIERMMNVFKLTSWFNTSCDTCNYVYQKYNPRMYVLVDEPEAKKRYDKRIAWCSNANTCWICYNMDKATFEDVRFDERFEFPMYFIIEFLARRRNSKKPGQLDYMNYYPSVAEELGVFKYGDAKNPTFKFDDEIIQKEGKVFGEMKVDNHPDCSVDVIMEDMMSAIMSD